MIVQLLNITEYRTAFKLQEDILARRIQQKTDDTLILLEHPSVIVIGRNGTRKNIIVSDEELQKKNIKVIETNRGGDVTVHSPGQLVGYPIIDIHSTKDIHRYLRSIEEALIQLLAEFDITGRRIDGKTGVWVGDEKIASIGIGARKWVTFHGFALNVNNNLEEFSLIHPCGMKNVRMTSLAKLLGRELPMAQVCARMVTHFKAQVYGEVKQKQQEPGERVPAYLH